MALIASSTGKAGEKNAQEPVSLATVLLPLPLQHKELNTVRSRELRVDGYPLEVGRIVACEIDPSQHLMILVIYLGSCDRHWKSEP